MENLGIEETPEKEPIEKTVETTMEPPKLGADFSDLETEEPEGGLIVDIEGTIFDPALHDTVADGTPKYRQRKGESTGIFAKKRGNKKGGNGTSQKQSKTEPTINQETSMVSFSPEVMSALFTSTYFQVMAATLGKEFSEPLRQTFYDEDSGKAVTFDEASMMQNSIKGIMVKKGVKSASPEMMLGLTMLTGVAVRANIEGSQVRSRVLKPFASTTSKIKGWFAGRKKKKADAKKKREEEKQDD